jgi:hypothetical protein
MSPPTEPLGYEVHCFSNGDPLPLCQRQGVLVITKPDGSRGVSPVRYDVDSLSYP